ncbi:MAG TPA: FAD-dependent oxidoreductase [Blastocatellia bacterium]|nr:FAD-dependent oxidoreductase [Blastocatellia bacterium]
MIRRPIYSPDVDPFIQREASARRVIPPAGASHLESLKTLAAPASPLRVVIVGAGLSGLCAAYELEQLGHTAVILEADAGHIGGRARTIRFGDGLYGEAGAMRIPKNHLVTRHYINHFKLPLRKFVQSNENAFYFVRGKRVRLGDENQLKPLFSLTPHEQQMSSYDMWKRAVVDLLQGLIKPELDDLDSFEFDTTNVRAIDQRSLQQLLEVTGLSEDAIEFLSSTWGLETTLPLAATEVLREELKAVWSLDFDEIVGGTDLLPKAFADNLKTRPRNGCEVVRLEQDSTGKKAAAIYRENGSLKREEGDFLICTLPLPVLSRLEVAPAFSGPKTEAIRRIHYDSATKVLAVARRRFWEQDDHIFGGGSSTDLPTGFTYYPSDNAGVKDPAVSAAPAVMLASYTWGQPARRLASLPHKDVADVVLRSLSNLHPQIAEEGIIERVVRWNWDNYPWSSGAYALLQPGQHTALVKDIISPEGRIFLAGEHTSLTHSWMQGALESAQRTVAELIKAAGTP